MTEPVSSTGAVILVKLYGMLSILAVAAFFAWLVVVMTRIPRTRSEWVVSLVTTAVGSITGGAFLVQRFNLHDWVTNMYGALAIGGIFFITGLPVWAIVRWSFNYINVREDMDIVEVIKEVKQAVKEIKGED